ncbi:MAG TPA: helix-turn-helix domain-containing protein [Candidatus Paceibacterota bacterium]|nr:helix-turn-helix domain-containing protein [Candidatus Paceibacterota bacterium]
MSKIIDQIENKELLHGLENFGLSEKESAVYLALLPRRETGSSKLVLATGLHKQFVYNALARLEELGLAKHVIVRGRKKFSANSPKRIVSILDEKKLSAAAMVRQLESRYSGAHEQDFEVYQGDDAFMAHQLELLKTAPDGSHFDVIATQTERYGTTFKETGLWDEYHRIQKEKNISIRYLGAEAQRERLEWREKHEPMFEYRILPRLAIGAMSIEVRPGNVSFVTYGDTLVDFTLSGQEVAESYRQFFETLWDLSKK